MGYSFTWSALAGLVSWGVRRVRRSPGDDHERLGVLHVAELGEVFGVGETVALDDDVAGLHDLVQGGAVAVL
ncbi:hypothetical protein ACYF6T_43125 [Streptomyces sp. 7R007]